MDSKNNKIYRKVENYFINKEQIKKYKTGKFKAKEEIILTNNNNTRELSINIDEFKDSTIIFKNCSFKTLKIVNSVHSLGSTIIFIDCVIEEGKILTNNKSNVEFINCYTKNLITHGKNISLSNCIKNSETEVCNISLGNIYTKRVNITNVSQTSSLSPIIISVQSSRLNIINSNFVLNPNCYDIEMVKSKIMLWKIQQVKNLVLNNSKLYSENSNIKNMTCSTVNIVDYSTISNFILDTKVLSIDKMSSLIPENTFIEVHNLLMLNNKAHIIKPCYSTSLIEANNIYLNPNSYISANNMQYENKNSFCIKVSLEKLKCERERLCKTLKLVENKCNKKIKELINYD